jgi:chorismate mutase
MKLKKTSKSNRQDIARQQKIKKRLSAEGVKLDHPQGQERFENVIEKSLKKKF